MSKRMREAVTGYVLVLPWIIGFLLFMAYPIYFSLYMSFNRVTITSTGIETQYIHGDNYKYAFLSDPEFVEKLLLFIKSVIGMIPIIIVFAMLVALLINQPIKMKGFFRAIFFLPVVITSGEVVNELFSQGATSIPLVEKYGIVQIIQDNLSPAWSTPIIGLIQQLILILWFSGVQILIFLAGLQKVNKQVFEAASIDGASPWVIFWKITLPAIKPFIAVNLIYTTVDLFTNSFSDVIVLIKENMFRLDTGFGYATALSWIYFGVIFVMLLLILLMFRNVDDVPMKRRKASGTR
ncbi:carbohydrate ABC transporter permease [Paenibacillus sp. R14(2021)]|uniref:carbohydrate ABC transporter permease n=1 Tax=Paenibacillus sp. R14(2021) TaxID=2859228 RepID=UPI001C616659|nr:sugar ABC transporter permease [Paenibacillus sp. R14(2021)]